jgi:ribosomal protein S18 acetylase RimI-like enzyme
MTTQIETKVIPCQYSDPRHVEAVARLINAYIQDAMGGGEVLLDEGQARLIDGLARHPKSIVLLAETNGQFCGLLTAFENFATFAARPMINVHDLIVLQAYRGQGVGRKLLEAVVHEAGKRHCCRITLEVRHDNYVAQQLYQTMGFHDADPALFYWRKPIDIPHERP